MDIGKLSGRKRAFGSLFLILVLIMTIVYTGSIQVDASLAFVQKIDERKDPTADLPLKVQRSSSYMLALLTHFEPVRQGDSVYLQEKEEAEQQGISVEARVLPLISRAPVSAEQYALTPAGMTGFFGELQKSISYIHSQDGQK